MEFLSDVWFVDPDSVEMVELKRPRPCNEPGEREWRVLLHLKGGRGASEWFDTEGKAWAFYEEVFRRLDRLRSRR